MATTSSEVSLVERLRARDEAAVGDLATTYGAKIYQLAFRYTRNREDAEEIVQDVLLKVFHKIAAFRGDAALSSWIYRITFNTAMSRLRSTRPVRHTLEDAAVPDAPRDVADWSTLAD